MQPAKRALGVGSFIAFGFDAIEAVEEAGVYVQSWASLVWLDAPQGAIVRLSVGGLN